MGRKLETAFVSSFTKGNPRIEPMRLRQVTEQYPKGGNAKEGCQVAFDGDG